MRVLVRKCPFTGKLFEEKDKKKYIKHLNETRARMRTERREAHIKETFFEWLLEEKKKITHPDLIPEWFLANQRTIMDAHNAGVRSKYHSGFGEDKFVSTDNFEKFSYERDPRFQDLLSNSHVCPDNGQTNWDGSGPAKVRGYPGWKVWVKGKLAREKKNNGRYPYSCALNLVGIKTGSGGGGNESWGYDASIFLADWPGLQVEYANILEERHQAEALAIINRLKGKR